MRIVLSAESLNNLNALLEASRESEHFAGELGKYSLKSVQSITLDCRKVKGLTHAECLAEVSAMLQDAHKSVKSIALKVITHHTFTKVSVLTWTGVRKEWEKLPKSATKGGRPRKTVPKNDEPKNDEPKNDEPENDEPKNASGTEVPTDTAVTEVLSRFASLYRTPVDFYAALDALKKSAWGIHCDRIGVR